MAKKETKKAPAKTWERKDRTYYLLGNQSPLTYTISSRNIMWYDKELGYEREIKYTANQKTPFVDEFKGQSRLEHIVFSDGVLSVPKEKVVLQQILSMYHPGKGKVYEEFDAEEQADDQLSQIELEFDAMEIAMSMEIDQAEAILRTELGSKVANLTSRELKRDLMVFAKKNPGLLIELANDENINVRNIGIKSVEQGIIKLSNDQRTFAWASNNRKLLTVPFDENPYSALASYFKTDEGIEVYQSVEKRLK